MRNIAGSVELGGRKDRVIHVKKITELEVEWMSFTEQEKMSRAKGKGKQGLAGDRRHQWALGAQGRMWGEGRGVGREMTQRRLQEDPALQSQQEKVAEREVTKKNRPEITNTEQQALC